MGTPINNTHFDDEPVRRPGDFYRSKIGTPYVSDPSGATVKSGIRKGEPCRTAYNRPSGFGKPLENTYNLAKWSERQLVLGLAMDYHGGIDLVARATTLIVDDRDTAQWRAAADGIVVEAKRIAKAGIAAERGSHAHALTEDDDEGRSIVDRIAAGEELGLDEAVQRSLVDAWQSMLERNGLEIVAVEMAVVHDGYRCAGNLDRVAKLTKSLRFRLLTGELIELADGTFVILDIKSGKRRLDSRGVVMYWQSYAVQVAIYAGGVAYDTDTEVRTPMPWPVDQHWALIAHLDVGGALNGAPSCELVLVDIEAGRMATELCVAARAWETKADVFSVAQVEAVESGQASLDDFDQPMISPTTALVTPVRAREGVPGLGLVPALATCSAEPDDFDAPMITGRPTEAMRWLDRPTVVPPPVLPTNPDEGSTQALEEAFAALQTEHGTLDQQARAWIGALSSQATRAHVGFHAHGHHTERRYWLIRGLVCLGHAHLAEDEVLRALVAVALDSDAPLFPAIAPGHALGSLDATRARLFAESVDAMNTGSLVGHIDSDGCFRLRQLATTSIPPPTSLNRRRTHGNTTRNRTDGHHAVDQAGQHRRLARLRGHRRRDRAGLRVRDQDPGDDAVGQTQDPGSRHCLGHQGQRHDCRHRCRRQGHRRRCRQRCAPPRQRGRHRRAVLLRQRSLGPGPRQDPCQGWTEVVVRRQGRCWRVAGRRSRPLQVRARPAGPRCPAAQDPSRAIAPTQARRGTALATLRGVAHATQSNSRRHASRRRAQRGRRPVLN